MGLRLFKKGKKVGDAAFASLTIQQVCRRMVRNTAVAVGVIPMPEGFIEEERAKGEDISDDEAIPVVAIAFQTLVGDDREYVIGRDDALGIAESIIVWLAGLDGLEVPDEG